MVSRPGSPQVINAINAFPFPKTDLMLLINFFPPVSGSGPFDNLYLTWLPASQTLFEVITAFIPASTVYAYYIFAYIITTKTECQGKVEKKMTWILYPVIPLSGQIKVHGRHYQSDMTIPALPGTDLVMVEANVSLCFRKAHFHCPASTCHINQI